ncbi:aromatic acid exporter family protein, partial [Bacillus sp. SIMBA_069]
MNWLKLKIGYRTLKTAIGTAISILLAQQLDLMFPASAG